MVIKLYGSAMATSRVLVILLEKGLPYELIRVDISKNEQNSTQHRERQPFGQCPALEDDGFWMFESRAICSKYSTEKQLMPDCRDIVAYAQFEQACGVEQNYFAHPCEIIGTELVIRPAKGIGEPDMTRVLAAESNIDRVLSYYESLLSKRKFLAGDRLTLVDLFHLPNGAALISGPWKDIFEKYPAVYRWFQSLRERESWKMAADQSGTPV